MLTTAFVLFGTVSSCGGSEANVPESSCRRCGGSDITAEECATWGEAAGCESSSFVPRGASSSCGAGCSFRNCDEPPSCGESGPGPSQDPVDAAVDPRCEASDDGLFLSDPPCDAAADFNLNGVTYYYCPCASPCPCGYTCGGLRLPVGGTIGGACAPQAE